MSLFQITSNSLQSNGVKIDRLIQFSDCAPSQYKNKTSFTDASFSEKDFGFRTEKHFFGSRHGKGPCDREIGVLKKKARLEVLSRNVNISIAKELNFAVLVSTICRNQMRDLQYQIMPTQKGVSHMLRKHQFKEDVQREQMLRLYQIRVHSLQYLEYRPTLSAQKSTAAFVQDA